MTSWPRRWITEAPTRIDSSYAFHRSRQAKDLGDNDASPIMRFPSRETFQETLCGWGRRSVSTVSRLSRIKRMDIRFPIYTNNWI